MIGERSGSQTTHFNLLWSPGATVIQRCSFRLLQNLRSVIVLLREVFFCAGFVVVFLRDFLDCVGLLLGC